MLFLGPMCVSAAVCRFVFSRQSSVHPFPETVRQTSSLWINSSDSLTFPPTLDETLLIFIHHRQTRFVFSVLLRVGRGSAALGPRSVPLLLGRIRLLSFHGRMDEADSATKALGLDEPPLGPQVEGAGSETESEAEVATMAVMAEPGNIDMAAESLPNPDEAEAAFAGKAGFS